tara:strand:+ start:662 stop:805 length:144 start_codon:yes stop_codon:yes gene_type:complete
MITNAIILILASNTALIGGGDPRDIELSREILYILKSSAAFLPFGSK